MELINATPLGILCVEIMMFIGSETFSYERAVKCSQSKEGFLILYACIFEPWPFYGCFFSSMTPWQGDELGFWAALCLYLRPVYACF